MDMINMYLNSFLYAAASLARAVLAASSIIIGPSMAKEIG
jgi:hypothetical protein